MLVKLVLVLVISLSMKAIVYEAAQSYKPSEQTIGK